MSKFVYKNSRKKCIEKLDATLTELDIWAGHFLDLKDTIGNSITELEEGQKRKKMISSLEGSRHKLINMRDELTELINSLDNNICDIEHTVSK